MTSLTRFLRASSSGWIRAKPIEVVIGNEAADADSCIGAILYAYFLHHRRPGSVSASHVVPIISCPKADFKLRREALVMLEEAVSGELSRSATHETVSIQNDLVCLDDLEAHMPLLKQLSDDGKLSITLVDHNQLTGQLARAGLGECVRAIIDHHADSGHHPQVTGDLRQISFDPIARKGVGSTCTLIADILRESDAGNSTEQPLLTAPIAELLLGVILLDTSCLSEHAGKATPHDHEAVRNLISVANEGRSRSGSPPVDINALYERLSGLRDDPEWWASLSPSQALGYDYKGFTHGQIKYGTGVLAMHATRFMRQPPADAVASGTAASDLQAPEMKLKGRVRVHALTLDAVLSFARSRGLDFFVLLSRAKGKRKAVFLWVGANAGSDFTEEQYKDAVSRFLRVPEVQAINIPVDAPVASAPALTAAGASSLSSAAAIKFGNHRISRKQVIPILDEVLSSVMTGS